MWTVENRARYDRSQLRYPSDLTDEEWALAKAQIPRAKRGGNKRTVDEREVMNGLMYVLSTGCQWRAIPKDLRWTHQFGQFGSLDKLGSGSGQAASLSIFTCPVCLVRCASG